MDISLWHFMLHDRKTIMPYHHHNNHHHHHHHQDLLDMTPSPSDSGISELEAALRDRDSELAYLRQTMEHNEKVIFKVHQVFSLFSFIYTYFVHILLANF